MLAAAIALYQPTLLVRGVRIAVDTGGDTLVTKRSAKLAPHGTITVLGRSDRAVLAPETYLPHWYLTNAIAASLGPTWIARGPVTFDFAAGTVSLDAAVAPATRLPIAQSHHYPFFDIAVSNARYTCLFDTGAVGRTSTSFEAVNTLDAAAFDSLRAAHPSWLVPGTITIASERGTTETRALRVPRVAIGTTALDNVTFVRREPRTFVDLSKMLGRRVQCDAGGALFAGRKITLDMTRGELAL